MGTHCICLLARIENLEDTDSTPLRSFPSFPSFPPSPFILSPQLYLIRRSLEFFETINDTGK